MSGTVFPDGGSYEANQPYNHDAAFQTPNTILEPAEVDSENGTLLLNYRPFNLNVSTYGDAALLRAIAAIPIQQASYAANKYNWTYKSRHSAQPILPFLYLGPASVARDATFISNIGITMVISVRSASSTKTQPKWLDPSRFPACAGLQTATFDVDNPFDVITRIRPIIESLTNHLAARTESRSFSRIEDVRGKILVICESGNERSPALVAAYLMLLYGITWHQSLNLIHTHRFSVCLNSGMNEMLKTWQDVLQAEFDVAPVIQSSVSLSNNLKTVALPKRATKRSIDDAYDPDDTMTDEHETAIRPGIAPFMDSDDK